MPLSFLVNYLDLKTEELKNARIHHANVDELGGCLFLYLESEHDQPVPLDFQLNWNDIFGSIICPVTGNTTFVDNIVVSKVGAEQLKARIELLERALVEYGIPIPHH